MSENICRRCGQTGNEPEMGDFSEYVKPAEQHLGTWEHYSMQGCITALRAALAAATAREAKPLPAGLATVEALLDYIQSAGVENPDPIRQRLHAALATHTERVVRWCFNNPPVFPDESEATGLPTDTAESYLARALAAAKGGA